MGTPAVITLNKQPSIWLTILRAFLAGKTTYKNGDNLKINIVEMPDVTIDLDHYNSFMEICDIKKSYHVMIQYLYTLVYHCMMQLWLQKEFTIRQFAALNTRTTMYLIRPVALDEKLTIRCHNSDTRPVTNGVEIDLISEIFASDEKIYESSTTYYIRGNYGPADNLFIPPKYEKLPKVSLEKQWFLKDQNNFRFGKLSGDTNPIHYISWYAKMYGFAADFAQPIRIISKCLDLILPDESGNKEYRLEYFLKGPVYYNSQVTCKYTQKDSAYHFEIFCEGNERPCIYGSVNIK